MMHMRVPSDDTVESAENGDSDGLELVSHMPKSDGIMDELG